MKKILGALLFAVQVIAHAQGTPTYCSTSATTGCILRGPLSAPKVISPAISGGLTYAKSGYAILGDSTMYPDGTHGATATQFSAGYKIAVDLNMPLASNYAIPGAESTDCFPLEITPNNLNPGPGYGTIPSVQGWSLIDFGINDSLNNGVSTNAQTLFTNNLAACAEWMGVPRKYKVMAQDPSPYAVLAGGFAASNPLINGGAISTSNGATATFQITTYGNKLHLLYGIYQQGALASATYQSGASVTGSAGQGCYVMSFNNSSTASGTIVLTGTNTIAASTPITFIAKGAGSGATAAPTTAVLSSGSATCSGTITITSTLGAGGAAGSSVGQVAVTIDGSSPSSNATLTAQAPGGMVFTSVLNGIAAITDATYGGITAGAHTVVVTTQNTGAFTIGGVLSQGPVTTNPPTIAATGVLHQNLCASDSTTGTFDTLAQAVGNALIADGIPGGVVDIRTAVGCSITDGTLANAGMSGNPTSLPDGTTGPASTSPGSHPTNVGYELLRKAVMDVIAPPSAAVQSGAEYSVNQDPVCQVVTANYALGSFWQFCTMSTVNSGAWPVIAGYNHNGASTVAPWHIYKDTTLGEFVLADSATEAVSAIRTETPIPRFAFKNPGSLLTFNVTGGSAATINTPSLPGGPILPLEGPNAANPTATYSSNTAFNLQEWGLANNVTTLNFVHSVAVQGGVTTTIYSCEPNSGGPYTAAAPSDFATGGGFQWPLASTSNFNSAATTCIMFDIVRLDANGNTYANKWVAKPYANLNLANAFTMPQAMPSIALGGDSAATAGARAFLNASTGPLTAIIANGQYNPAKIVKAGTIENIEGSSSTFTCTGNPTFTLEDCGTSAGTCSSPSVLASVTLTAANTITDGTITSAVLTAGHYVTWESTAGTCAAINLNASAEYRMN
jgi:hypothetical protein